MPRPLPCFHALYEKCIKETIKESKLTCPESREEYEAKKQEKNFQQNPYILAQISRIMIQKQGSRGTGSFL